MTAATNENTHETIALGKGARKGEGGVVSRRPLPIHAENASSAEWSLAEILRLRAWLKILSDLKVENSAEERVVRRVRYIARRALQGDKI